MSSPRSNEPRASILIALIGDLHGHWTDEDVAYFNESKYDLLLVTGDLGSGTRKNGVQIAKSIARLRKPTLVVAGNNDAPFAGEIAAEFRVQSGLVQMMKLAPSQQGTENRSGNVSLTGYDMRTMTVRERSFTIVVGRPYAMGGSELSFAQELETRYAIKSFEESERRLCELVEQAPTRDIVVLAHNGPVGLGSRASDIWGCDFKPEQGDWGDRDLRTALGHATRRGKRVLAVVAGHMHRGHRRPRTSTTRQSDTLYVNPALVPRVFPTEDGLSRHHMALELDEGQASARDVYVR